MELKHVKGNTYYVEGRQLMPLYLIDDQHCILMDPGRQNEREGFDALLQARGLTPVGVIISHVHYDHCENASYFQKKYGAKVAMARQDADLCSDEVALRNHLYTFTPKMLREVQRLRDVICVADLRIEPSETTVSFCGVPFGILHTPGHSPAHICVVTPDDVCFAGDVLMTEKDLHEALVPFVFDLAADMESKRKLEKTRHAAYLFSHQGVVTGSLAELTEKNLVFIDEVLDLFLRNIPEKRSLCQIYAAVNQELGLHKGHPIRAFYLERYLRPYLDYLIDEGRLVPVDGGGAPTLAQPENA